MTDPLWGPIMKQVPGLSQELPEFQSPTRAETPRDVAPLNPTFTGMRVVEPRNQFEKELIKQDFQWNEISPSTGDPELDLLMREAQGEVADQVGWITETAEFQQLTNKQKGLALKLMLSEIRKQAKLLAASKATGEQRLLLFQDYVKDSLGQREEFVIEEAIGTDLKSFIEQAFTK